MKWYLMLVCTTLCMMYERSKTGKGRKQRDKWKEKDGSYFETDEDVSRVYWIKRFRDNNPSDVHERMQHGAKMGR